MATYNVLELLNRLHTIYNAECKFCEVSVFESDEDSSESLFIEPINLPVDYYDIEDDPIESCNLTDIESYPITLDSFCHEISFTFSELFSLHESIKISIKAQKDAEKDLTTREQKDSSKELLIRLRNLDAKLAKLFKNVS